MGGHWDHRRESGILRGALSCRLHRKEEEKEMFTAEYVDGFIKDLLADSSPKEEKVWNLALACVGWPYIFGDRGQYCTSGQRQAVYVKHPDQEGLVKYCQILNGSKASCTGCKWYPNGKRVRSFDCQGFVRWILAMIYGWEPSGGGCTSQWNNESNWKAKGLISEGMPENTLLCLFYRSKKEPNKMAHTGIYFRGETCECSNGVQHSKTLNKKWTHWAVPVCLDSEVPEVVPVPKNKPTIKRGSKGESVKECQEALIQLGYDVGSTGADGIFGKNTESAVVAFQIKSGLKADGIVGTDTWKALEDAISEGKEPDQEPEQKKYTVSISGLTFEQAEELTKTYPNAKRMEENGL